MIDGGLLLRVLREPKSMPGLVPAEWDLVLRQARAGGNLARLCAFAQAARILGVLPVRVRERLETAHAEVAQQHRLIRWEVTRVRRALAYTGAPLVLLKGAAYLFADLPAAHGRPFSDVDLLVPRDRLQAVEEALLKQGWEFIKVSAYDQRFYREWAHELPPMVRKNGHIIVDVHHNILPPTGRLRPDPRLLLEAARPISGSSLSVLAPTDMLLHSACHLLQSGELDTSLRDLTDLHVLMGHFGTEAGFWQDLVARAVALGVERPLYYALRFAVRLLRTPVPVETLRALASAAPASAVRVAMDILVSAAIVPTHPLRPQRVRLARALLSIRHHWLRMPPLLLMRHALHKALAGRTLGAGSSVAL